MSTLDVAIDVLGDSDAGVTQNILDLVKWDALREHHRRGGVPELVRIPWPIPARWAAADNSLPKVEGSTGSPAGDVNTSPLSIQEAPAACRSV